MCPVNTNKRLVPRDLPKKRMLIAAGLILSAYGITLALYAGFGGATLAVLWQGISHTFQIRIGAVSFAVAVLMILFAWIYDRKQIFIGTAAYQILYSCGKIIDQRYAGSFA